MVACRIHTFFIRSIYYIITPSQVKYKNAFKAADVSSKVFMTMRFGDGDPSSHLTARVVDRKSPKAELQGLEAGK